METLGDRLKFYRLIKKMSQEDVADLLDISRNAYANMERNITDVSYSRLLEVAKILDVHIFDLVAPPQERYSTQMDDKDQIITNLQKTIMELVAKMEHKRPRRAK